VSSDQYAPLQQQVYEELFAAGQPRPSFPPDLSRRLRAQLYDGVAEAAQRLELVGEFISITKQTLSKVHGCELHYTTDRFPGWSAALARGTIADKAIELGVHAPVQLAPADMVDLAIGKLRQDGDEWTPREWLNGADPVELAELRAGAIERVTKFTESFPPLAPEWNPILQWKIDHVLVPGVLALRARPDLKLGRPRPGHQAGVLFVDFKTGRVYQDHIDDLRFYALVETLRSGVPPFRVASYYLDQAEWHHEDIDETSLDLAVRRAVDGIVKLVELRLDEREPAISPGPACNYGSLRETCAGAATWRAETTADATS
jgi:hypothetical protein